MSIDKDKVSVDANEENHFSDGCVEDSFVGDGDGWTGVLDDGHDNGSGDALYEDCIEDLVLPSGEDHIPTHLCNMELPTEWK